MQSFQQCISACRLYLTWTIRYSKSWPISRYTPSSDKCRRHLSELVISILANANDRPSCILVNSHRSLKLSPFVTFYGYRHSLEGATLFSEVDSNKLRFNVKNEMALIWSRFDADLTNISTVTSRKTKWPAFWPTLYAQSVIIRHTRWLLASQRLPATTRM